MRRTLYFVVALALVGSILAACAPAATPTPTPKPVAPEKPTEPPSAEPLKVVLLINGVLGDKSFFDSAQRGVDRAVEEFDIEVKTIEAGIDAANWEAALVDSAATEEYDILICGTWQMNDYLGKVAPEYPDKKFMIFDTAVDYSIPGTENVYSVLYKQNEGSYLAGIYAAMMTQKDLPGMNPAKVIGTIGGQDIPVINDFILGYKQGALEVDPETQIIVQYAGGWNDPAKGKEITLAMYEQGADIVFSVAGGTGMGIFEAAEEQAHYAIGVDSDQATIIADTDPGQAERILTSMLKNVDNSLYRALKMHLEGTLKYGEAEYLGIEEGGVGLAYNEIYEQNTPDDVKAAITAAEQRVLNGEVTIDTAF